MLRPFSRYCVMIGAIPESIIQSISYEKQLIMLIKFLKETVIPAIDGNAEAIEELQEHMVELQAYVDNYFNNLDVQEEINNKLDSMVTDGTLSNMIGRYITPYITEMNETLDEHIEYVNGKLSEQDQDIANIEQIVTNIGNQTPIVVDSTDDMTDTTKIYVNTTDGKWYYYNGSSWTIGGTYQSTGIGEKSIFKKNLEQDLQNNFKMEMESVSGVTWHVGGFYTNTGALSSNENYAYSDSINVNTNDVYMYPNSTSPNVTMWDSSNNFVGYINGNTNGFEPFVIPDGVSAIKLNKSTSATIVDNGKLYKIKNYYLDGQSQLSYGDMDSAFQNSFEPVYADITEDLTWGAGFWDRRYKNKTTGVADASYHSTQLNVIPGEIYKITGTYAGNVLLYQLIGNSAGSTVNYPENAPASRTSETVTVTIPDGVYILNVSGYADGRYTDNKVEKINGYNFVGVNSIDDYDIVQLQKFNIQEQLKNDFKWSASLGSGKFATFTFDDSLADISSIETLFESKEVPCCFATIPSRLGNITTSGETVKQVLQRAVLNGGEVLSHNLTPLTSSSSDNDYYSVYVGNKKVLYKNGFDVNGLIVAGGTNYNTQDFAKDTEIARNNYLYSDLTSSDNTDIEQYYNRRNFLDDGVASIKTLIDNYVAGTGTQPYSKWLNFASHGTNDTSLEDIEEIIDYCISNDIQIVTWKYLYDHYKSSVLEERINNL